MEKALKVMNLCFFVAMIVVNIIGEYLPLGISNTSKISRNYPTLFTPAPVTFAIWGIIYLFMAFFAIYQLNIGAKQMAIVELVRLIGPWFIISCLCNIGWMISWHFDKIWLSLIFMVVLLFSLIMISYKYDEIGAITTLTRLSRYGFDIYLGWITVATIANLSVFLVKIQWSRWGRSDQFWTIIVLLVGAVIGILFVFQKHRYFSTLTIVWAYIGIIIKHVSQNGYFGEYPMIITTAIVGIVLMASVIIIEAYMQNTI